ncbi:MAG: PspA/IM30 family protein [bacterium]
MNSFVFAAVIVFVVVSFSGPGKRMFKAFLRLLGAKMDTAAEEISKIDPLAEYRSQIASNAEKAKMAQQVVNTAAKQLVSLKSQLEEDFKDKERLSSRIEKALTSNNESKATTLALELQRVEKNIAENSSQLEVAQKSYDENLSFMKKFEEKIISLRKDCERLGMQLSQSEAEKALAEATAAMKNSINISDLSEIRNNILEQINSNKGTVLATKDMSFEDEDEETEEERKLQAAEVLSRFRKSDSN